MLPSRHLWACLWLFALPVCLWAQPRSVTVTGRVTDEQNEPLPGAYVRELGTVNGTIVQSEGEFTLRVAADARIEIRMMGFKPETLSVATLTSGEVLVKLVEEPIQTEDVVVSASRVAESILSSPVTIEKITVQHLRETPALNMYDAVATLKGVDQMASSLTFKALNTRGFNSPANARFVQRIDGIDMQAPGLNMPPGMLNGSADLDLESVELLPGASSALYGPNAFNGILNITTKSPFQYPGLSVNMRMGANHLDSRSPEPSAAPFIDFAARYAKVIGRRFAVKANFAYLAGQDWQANDRRDVADYAGTANLQRHPLGVGNPGYDALNVYGDEVASTVDSSFFPDVFFLLNAFIPDSADKIVIPATRIARTGYAEHDLLDYDTYSLRGDLSLHYRLGSWGEVSATSRLSRGTSVLQADNRISLNDFIYHNHKLELTGEHFFVRAYATFENAGNSYDSRFASFAINRAWKSDTNWFAQYNFAYYGILNGIHELMKFYNIPFDSTLLPQGRFDDARARAFADGDNSALGPALEQALTPLLGILPPDQAAAMADLFPLMNGQARYLPGSTEFNDALSRARQDPDWNTGARFIDKTSFYHAEGQYDFSHLLGDVVELQAGGSYRNYQINSEGTIFADTTGPITVQEWGAYAQATRRLFNERFRLTASGRVDQTQRFEPRFTPRLSAVVSLGKYKQHNLRGSYQTGFRMPELRHQFVSFPVGPYTVIGGFNSFFTQNGLVYNGPEGEVRNNAYTLTSVRAFRETGDSAQLRRATMNVIRPEFTRSIEVGYKAVLLPNLMVDLAAYWSRYENFIGSLDFVGPSSANIGTENVAIDAADAADDDSLRYFRRYVNSTRPVRTFGFSGGLMLALSAHWALTGNYTYAEIFSDETRPDELGLRTEFNTPRHKANAGLVGRNLTTFLGDERLGCAIQYRWVDAFLFQYGFGNGTVPAFATVDAQVSYKLPKLHTILKLGGTNVLQNRHIEMFGGPTVGGMVYVQLTYDELLN